MGQAARKFDPDANPRGNERQMPRIEPGVRNQTPIEVDFSRGATRGRVNRALSREAHDEEEAAAPGNPAASGQVGEGTPEGFLQTVKYYAKGAGEWSLEKANELRSSWREVRQLRKAYNKGELTKEMLEEASDSILDLLGLEITRGLAPYTLVPLVSWYMNARDHALEKTAPDYSDLTGQIMASHEDEDHPGLYRHAMESLCAGMEEKDLFKHYSVFRGVNKFRQTYGTPEGRKKIKDQLGKLLGSEVDEIHELTGAIEEISDRLGITITGTPPAATLTPNDFQHRHATHSLHALNRILQTAYNEVTAARLTKITGPNEDVKLEKDINKLGNTLMEHVKGSTDLAEQFLGNLDLNVFDKTFRHLRTPDALDETMQDSSGEVKTQLYSLLNLSDHVTPGELNAFTEALIGPAPYPPAAAATPVAPSTPDILGGALGSRNALNDDARRKFDALRGRIHLARVLLLEDANTNPVRPAGAIATPAPSADARIHQLFPARAETIKYEDFGAQLGKAVRNKNGASRLRARSIFLRGWDRTEFTQHFLQLTDAGMFTNVAEGEQAGKDKTIELIREITGIKNAELNEGLVDGRIDELITHIQDTPANPTDTLPAGSAERAKMGQLVTELRAVRTRLSTDWGRLFPAQKEAIDYSHFGTQLGKAVRGKTDNARLRARSAYLRGWEHDEFEDHFIQLMNPTTFSAGIAGPQAQKDEIKVKIQNLTGLSGANLNHSLLDGKIGDLITRIQNSSAADTLTAGSALETKMNTLVTDLTTIRGQLTPANIDSLYEEPGWEERLGATIRKATPANVEAIFSRINPPFLTSHYSLLTQNAGTVAGQRLAERQQFKAQLGAFLGAPKLFLWNDFTTNALLTELETKAGEADTAYGPAHGGAPHPGAVALRAWITNFRTNFPMGTTFFADLNAI